LAECKSGKHPLSKKEAVDFIDKLRSHRCKRGILITLSGISGNADRDALARIRDAFVRDGFILMMFSLEDLQHIQLGEDPTGIFYDEYEKIKFM
jgi:hypothetical protein